MILNPDVQRKAQEAIDASISLAEGLPDFSLFGELPYIEALVREVFRWRPVTPIGQCLPSLKQLVLILQHKLFLTPSLKTMFTTDFSSLLELLSYQTAGKSQNSCTSMSRLLSYIL
jgi:Cytochrome P450